MNHEWVMYLRALRGEFVQMAKGSGHWGHRGRKGKRGGSLPSRARGASTKGEVPKGPRAWISIPGSNKANLDAPSGDLTAAKTKDGREVRIFAYNPKTSVLVAGGDDELHAEVIDTYAKGQKYDDFVKMNYLGTPEAPQLLMDLTRVTAKDPADAWVKGAEAAHIMRRGGFPPDTILQMAVANSAVARILTLEEIAGE